jgi:hypothetical protein
LILSLQVLRQLCAALRNSITRRAVHLTMLLYDVSQPYSRLPVPILITVHVSELLVAFTETKTDESYLRCDGPLFCCHDSFPSVPLCSSLFNIRASAVLVLGLAYISRPWMGKVCSLLYVPKPCNVNFETIRPT